VDSKFSAWGLVWSVVGIFVSALATATMWRWFLVPLGVSAIGYAHACGFTLIAKLLTITPTWHHTEDEHPALTSFVYCVVAPVLVLALAWIAKMVMG